jgi:hypothetical protein
VFSPNSAQDWLIPNHLNLPVLEVDEVLVAGAEDVVVELALTVVVELALTVVVEVVEVFSVVAAVPGKHWLYQSLL